MNIKNIFIQRTKNNFAERSQKMTVEQRFRSIFGIKQDE